MRYISVQDLHDLLAKNNATIIDVRQPDEYQMAHIPGSILIPLAELHLDKLPKIHGKLVVHCASGRRSTQACELLSQLDTEIEVYNLEGGINAWKQAGFEVEQG